jgi:hypothetical protein
MSVYCLFRYRLRPETFGYTHVCLSYSILDFISSVELILYVALHYKCFSSSRGPVGCDAV